MQKLYSFKPATDELYLPKSKSESRFKIKQSIIEAINRPLQSA